MKGHKALVSHKSDEWATPPEFYKTLDEQFHFDFDMAATANNRVCEDFTNNIEDFKYPHLVKMAWCNPPYSNQRVFVEYSLKNKMPTVFLLPARTDTKLFHELIYTNPDIQVQFIKGRLKFSGALYNAPFPSMLVIYMGSGA